MLAALAEPEDPALDPALRAAVAQRTVEWAREVADVVDVLDGDPADAVAGLDHAGPVLLVAPDVPHLDASLAPAALGDLAAGCAASFAPATDGRPYLLAFPSPTAPAVSLLSAEDRHRDSLFAAAIGMGEIGLLRSERRCVTPADALALAIDPLTPPDLRALTRRV